MEEESAAVDLIHQQVDRIVHSQQFHSSEVLRKLLIFLTEKSITGEAENLKEYVVAIDGLGKSQSYDPQHHSAVRIQMGRLRQRLGEYYRTEGKNDPIVVDLPKGRFRLTFEQRSIAAPSDGEVSSSETHASHAVATRSIGGSAHHQVRKARWIPLLAIAFGWLLVFGLGYFVGHVAPKLDRSTDRTSPDLEALWGPFLNGTQPLILSIEDPLFAELRSNPGVYFRDRSMNEWSDVALSSELKQLSGVLKYSEMRPSRYYTAFGEAEASFLLGSMLRTREHPPSFVRTSQLSWQQLADNNVIFVGVQNLFFNQLRNMPIAPQLVPELNGVRDEAPSLGQPAFYADAYTTAPSEEGTIYALVTHLPGPNGKNDIESFTSNRSAGYLGAVQSFTDPRFAHMVETKLSQMSGGRFPRYYQVLLEVRYRDGVPTETRFVLGREMH